MIQFAREIWHVSSALASAKGTSSAAQVTFTVRPIDGEDDILAVTVGTYNGIYEVDDIRSVIEDYLIQNLKTFAFFVLQEITNGTETDTATIKVVYSATNMKAAQLTTPGFLTSHRTSSIYRGQFAYLTYLAEIDDTDTVTFDLLTTDANGRYKHERWTEQRPTENYHYMENVLVIYWGTLLAICDGRLPLVLNIKAENQRGIVRRHTFYCIDREPDLTLLIRNKFNAQEVVSLFGTLTARTETVQEMTNIANTRVFYDSRTTHAWKFESTALSKAEADFMPQLIYSPLIQAYMLGYDFPEMWPRLILTSSECELTDSDEELPHFSFEYEFAEDRPKTDENETDIETDIFTPPYDDTFA